MINLSPEARYPFTSKGIQVRSLRFVPSAGSNYIGVYAQYSNCNDWVPIQIGLSSIPSLQQVRDVDRNISLNTSSYLDAHFYLRSADGNNVNTAFFTNKDGGGIQSGNTTGYVALNLQPLGGLLNYGGNEVATKIWTQAQGYLITETDPTVPSYVKSILPADIANWNGKENTANKSTTVTLGASDVLFPTQKAVKTYVDNAITTNNGNYIPVAQKGAANGVASLGADGKIPGSQIPAIAITNTFVVASQAAMLALSTAETGDIAVRTDINESFILTNNSPGTLGSWQQLLSPTITSTDQIPEGSTNLYFTTARARASISVTGNGSYNAGTGVITINAGNAGTVTQVASGNLNPLFNTAVSTATTTPTISFTAISQAAKAFYAAPNAAAGIPVFRSIVPLDLGTGTPTASTYLNGAGVWTDGSGNFIQNQTTAVQTGNYRISGYGQVDQLGIGGSPGTGIGVRYVRALTGDANPVAFYINSNIQSDATGAILGYSTFIGTAAASFTTSSLTHFIARQAPIGAGSTLTSQVGFYAQSTLVGATTNVGFRSDIPVNSSSNWNLFMAGTAWNYIAGRVGLNTQALTNVSFRNSLPITGSAISYANYSDGIIQSDVTSLAYIYSSVPQTQAASFTLPLLAHYYASQGTIGAGSTITTQYGLFINSSLIGASNNYGIVSQIPTGANNNWNLYMSGSAPNYLAGKLGIGTTNMNSNVHISLPITGATTFYNVSADGTIVSDVTATAVYFRTAAQTQAATFTLATLIHYQAEQGSIGAGSTITTQIGFQAAASMISGGTNLGFRGSIPSGTNRYNLYMDGTAQNYFAGNVGIGSGTSTPTYALVVSNGTVAAAGTIAAFTQNGGSVQIGNQTSTANQFIPTIRGNGVGQTAAGLLLIGQGSDTFSTGAINLSARNAAGTGGITGGKILSIQNYNTTEYFAIDYLGATAITTSLMVGLNTTTVPAFFATAMAFPALVPIAEFRTGITAGTVQEGIVIRHTNNDNTAVSRETGLFIKLSSEGTAGESQKGGAITMKSSNAFANTPDMNFYILADANPKMTIKYTGVVNIASLATATSGTAYSVFTDASGNLGKRGFANFVAQTGVDYNSLSTVGEHAFIAPTGATNSPNSVYNYYMGFGGGDVAGRGAQLAISHGGTGEPAFYYRTFTGVGTTVGWITLASRTWVTGLGYTTNTGTVTNVTGTTNRVTITNGTTTPVIDISSAYTGQASITTLGTVNTGTWNGAIIGVAYGGTGLTASGANGNIMVSNGSGWISQAPSAIFSNIYTADGTLTGDRIVSLSNHKLNFDNYTLNTLDLSYGVTIGSFASGLYGAISLYDPLNHKHSSIRASNVDANFRGGIDLISGGMNFEYGLTDQPSVRFVSDFNYGNYGSTLMQVYNFDTADYNYLVFGNASGKVWSFPDKHGVIALASDVLNIYNSNGTLTGNRIIDGAHNDLIFNSVGTLGLNSFTTTQIVSDGEVDIQSNANSVYIQSQNFLSLTSVTDGILIQSQIGTTSFGGKLFTTNLTAARSWQMPDANGTIALQEWVTGNNFIKQGGNSFGTAMTIGTNDNNLLYFKINGAAIAGVNLSSYFFGNGLANAASSNNATIDMLSTGTVIRRNIADGGHALTINNASTSSTGAIAMFQYGATNKAMVDKDGYGRFNRVGVGSSLAAPSYLLDVNAGTLTGLNTIAQFGQNTGFFRIGNGTGVASSYITQLISFSSTGVASGMVIVSYGSDAYTGGSIALSSRNAAGTGAIIGGKILSVQNYTTEYLAIDYLGATTLANLAGTGTRIVTASSTGLLSSTSAIGIANGGTGLTSVGTNGQIMVSNGSSWVLTTPTWTSNTGTVTNVTGTTNRTVVTTGTTTPVIDIASTYVGQTSITTLGTIATGTWNATTIAVNKGGTGLTAAGASGNILVSNGTGWVSQAPSFTTTNIYNSNGTLTGDRTIDGGNHALINTNVSFFEVNSNSGINLSSNGDIEMFAPNGFYFGDASGNNFFIDVNAAGGSMSASPLLRNGYIPIQSNYAIGGITGVSSGFSLTNNGTEDAGYLEITNTTGSQLDFACTITFTQPWPHNCYPVLTLSNETSWVTYGVKAADANGFSISIRKVNAGALVRIYYQVKGY